MNQIFGKLYFQIKILIACNDKHIHYLMKVLIVLCIVIAVSFGANIQAIPQIRSQVKGEFDNATIEKNSRQTKIIGKSKIITVLNVPDVFQATDYTCGPSSVSAVMSYYHKYDIREMDWALLALTSPITGSNPQKLHRAITRSGFKAQIYQQMTVSSLQSYLAGGRPVIVLIQAWKDEDDIPYDTDFQNGHYVVAIGYDNENIYFEDPWIHGSLTYMAKIELARRWHGNTDEPQDRHVYGSAIIILEDIVETPTIIQLQ